MEDLDELAAFRMGHVAQNAVVLQTRKTRCVFLNAVSVVWLSEHMG